MSRACAFWLISQAVKTNYHHYLRLKSNSVFRFITRFSRQCKEPETFFTLNHTRHLFFQFNGFLCLGISRCSYFLPPLWFICFSAGSWARVRFTLYSFCPFILGCVNCIGVHLIVYICCAVPLFWSQQQKANMSQSYCISEQTLEHRKPKKKCCNQKNCVNLIVKIKIIVKLISKFSSSCGDCLQLLFCGINLLRVELRVYRDVIWCCLYILD